MYYKLVKNWRWKQKSNNKSVYYHVTGSVNKININVIYLILSLWAQCDFLNVNIPGKYDWCKYYKKYRNKYV